MNGIHFVEDADPSITVSGASAGPLPAAVLSFDDPV
jgi:hypothetical protein